MYHKYFFLILFLAFPFFGRAEKAWDAGQHEQDGNRPSNGVIRMIKNYGESYRAISPNKKISVWLKDSEQVLQGKYEVVSDTSIAIDGQVVMIGNIAKISGFNIASLLSPFLVAGGTGSIGFGVIAAFVGAHFLNPASAYSSLFFIGSGFVLVGAAVLTVGICIWHRSKTFRLGEKWQIVIADHQTQANATPPGDQTGSTGH